METGMKLWLLGAAVLATAVVHLTVPPRTTEELDRLVGRGSYVPHTAEEAARWRLTRATRQANQTLQSVRWADSLVPLVVEHGRRGVWIGLPSPETPEEEARELRAFVDAEIGLDAPGEAAVGAAFLPWGAGGYPGALTSSMAGYFFGERNGTPYCVVARSGRNPRDIHTPALPYGLDRGDESITGLCRWIHRYGLPRGEVRAWMEGWGATMAQALEPFDGEALAYLEGVELERRGAFGVPGGVSILLEGGFFSWALDPARDRCLAGYPDDCVAMAMGSWEPLDRPRFDPRGSLDRKGAFDAVWGWPVWRQEAFLLRTLEDEFGPERFRSFWTSQAPVPGAFQEAFGEPMGPWLQDWYASTMEPSPPGPMPRAAGFLSALAVLLLSGAASTFLVGRWRVTQ